MKRILDEVAEQTRDSLLDFRERLKEYSGLTDEQVVTRYVTEHRGKPEKMLGFARKNHKDPEQALDAAVEYERTMESLLKQYRRD